MDTPSSIPWIWQFIGILAACIFYGRFYMQWIVSEIKGRSVIPVLFWYMSSVGSLMLLSYAVYLRSPVGALSHCFNIVIYARNLVHIWREKGKLSRARSILLHSLVALILIGAIAMVGYTWLNEYSTLTKDAGNEAPKTWFWLLVGVVGQGLFGCRFILQWLVTEAKKKSVVPLAFWYISFIAALLLMSSHLQRGEWVFSCGIAATLLVYLRNIWLIQVKGKEKVEES